MSLNYSKRPTSLINVTPSTFPPQADSLTYEPHFGLTEKPFSLNADPRFTFDSPSFKAAREGLLAGVRRREGLLVLTGEIGTGKTTLCRTVLRDLGRKTYSSLVRDPFASREDLLKTLLIDFGALTIPELTSSSLQQATRTELGYLLAEFFEALPPDAFVIAMIDEAQNLSLPLIEETRILADNFGAEGRLQIIFVGQPELHAKLKLPEMRQVDQRICGYHRVAPMSREAVDGYIQHRLQVAGRRSDRALFPPAVIDLLHRRSGGVPRLINRICDRALQLAFERKADSVDREVLDTALIEVGPATLSPTWDAIVFSEAVPAAPAAAPPAAAEGAAAEPAAAPAADEVVPVDGEAEIFKKEIERWVSQELAAPSRLLPPTSSRATGTAPAASRPQTRTAARPASRRSSSKRPVVTDWPRDLRSETYLRRLLRRSVKWTAIVAASLVALNLGVTGASRLLALLSPLDLPAAPEAPARMVPGPVPPDLTGGNIPWGAAPADNGRSGEFLVAVGLFASAERADQLSDELTRAGLPAMQRLVQLRGQPAQQVVLGPFFSRADAAADLVRLQRLGGYADARVLDASPDPPAARPR